MNTRIKIPVKKMTRVLPVCANCWDRRFPTQPASRGENVGKDEQCIDCETKTNSGIYVRMTVEWE